MKMKIRDITKKDLDFYRFRIHNHKDKFVLIMEQKSFGNEFFDVIRLETSSKRLIQLANDILTFCNQKAKIKEWKPTNEEYIWALERKFGKNNHMHFFVVDWIRQVVNMKNEEGIKQAREIYEWLKGNEEWLYEQKLFKEGSKSS